MNIGTAAKRSGVLAKTVRYYEGVGLIPPAMRRANGYRRYHDVDVQTLRFIHRARGLGFSVQSVADLLALWRDQNRASADVRDLALQHVDDVARKIQELETIRQALNDLIEKCHGDNRPNCPILADLAGITDGTDYDRRNDD